MPNIIKRSFVKPLLALFLGILLSFALWGVLLHEVTHTHFLVALELASPWLILISGILISILIAFMVFLSAQNKQRLVILTALNEQYNQEFAEKTRAQENKQHFQKALLQGQKLQAMGTLAAGIAHDFNNILYAIIGYAEMAHEDALPESTTQQNLGKVLEASYRGQELIARILAFSRPQHHDFHPVLIKKTIENILSLLKSTIPSSVVLQVKAMEEDHWILGNEIQLHQVIVNLINNAVDAMDGEGTIILSLDYIRSDDAIFNEFLDLKKGHYCKIEIKDTGHGMEQSVIERIFEPFFTTKEVGKGTGLGLATVHTIVSEHQGKMRVTSQLGIGTQFTVLLPEYREEKT